MTTSIQSIDGVQRYPDQGIKVIVIGAGVGGLATALECWRKGCDVVVLEKASQLSPLGDYFTITPSGLTTLRDYPGMFADYHERTYDCTVHLYSASGVPLKSAYPEWSPRDGIAHAAPEVDISFLKRRPVFAQMQLNQLTRVGVPVHFGHKVDNVHEEDDSVTVTTADGKVFQADVCILATGVGSLPQGFPTMGDEEVLDTGYAVARVAFPRCIIKPGSLAEKLLVDVDEKPKFITYAGKDVHIILFLTKDWVAWTFTHANDGTAAESWHNLKDAKAVASEIAKTGDDWDPALLDFVEQTPSQVVDWSLRFRNPIEKWTSEGGRLLRLGDSAHPFLPTAGMGAVQAIEDGVSIGECLRSGGKADVQWATKVHNRLRFERTSILQRTGFVNRQELHDVAADTTAENSAKGDAGFFKIGRWAWGHNPETYASENFSACLASLKHGAQFQNTNLPPGHVYEPWTLASESERMSKGIRSTLKQNGHWGN